MRKRKKKGTAPKAQHPNTNHKSHFTRVEYICLWLFIAFLILFIGGCYIHHAPMKFTGLGIGISILLIQTDINLYEGEDDDIWEE